MELKKVVQRFLLPPPLISLYYFLKFKCKVSPKSEVEFSDFVKIGKNTQISAFTKIKASVGPFVIGEQSSISTGCFISAHTGGIIIGDFCMIGPNACIVGNNHKYDRLDVPMIQQGIASKGIKIGDNVWVGAGSAILDGSEIGSGVIITPNSVVSSKIPENTIVSGNPAKVIFKRR